MIADHHRLKGAVQLGATGPGTSGPFGRWPDVEDDGQEHDPAPARTVRAAGDAVLRRRTA